MAHQPAGGEAAAAPTGPGRGRQRITKRGLFIKDLPDMLIGFGDQDPQRDVVGLMEELVVEHVTDVLSTAHKISTNRGKLKLDDIVFALRASSSRTHPPSSTSRPGSRSASCQSDLSPRYAPYPLARRKASLAEKQLARIEELLFMQEDIARAKGRPDDLRNYADDYGDKGAPGQAPGLQDEKDKGVGTVKGKKKENGR